MSEKLFSNRRQQKRRQAPYPQKSSISAKESCASEKAANLMAQLHNLTGLADFAENRADFYWEKGKYYETQGRMDKALELNAECEVQAYIAKECKKKINQIVNEIARLHGVNLVRLQKGENYARIKVKEPPSDNQE